MALCQRVKIDRVFYDQRMTLSVLNENIFLTGLLPAGIPLDNVTVDVSVVSCDFDLANQTIDIEFFVKKTLTFGNIVIEFSFNPLVPDIPLPKLGETNIPTEFLDRLKCQVFDFIPLETASYDPANQNFIDTLDIDITIKIDAVDQILVSLCPNDNTRTVTVTP